MLLSITREALIWIICRNTSRMLGERVHPHLVLQIPSLILIFFFLIFSVTDLILIAFTDEVYCV